MMRRSRKIKMIKIVGSVQQCHGIGFLLENGSGPISIHCHQPQWREPKGWLKARRLSQPNTFSRRLPPFNLLEAQISSAVLEQ
jgi:hypothetical protein